MPTSLVAALALLAILAGCADAAMAPSTTAPGPRAWDNRAAAAAVPALSDAEAGLLTDEVVALKAQRGALANNLARVPGSAARAQQARTIDEIDGRLQALEQRLRTAGRPVPR